MFASLLNLVIYFFTPFESYYLTYSLFEILSLHASNANNWPYFKTKTSKQYLFMMLTLASNSRVHEIFLPSPSKYLELLVCYIALPLLFFVHLFNYFVMLEIKPQALYILNTCHTYLTKFVFICRSIFQFYVMISLALIFLVSAFSKFIFKFLNCIWKVN